MAHIAILVHRAEAFENAPYYYLHGIANFWRAQGHRVSVVRSERDAKPADLAILHVDLTVVPAEYLALASRYPACLNRYTADISKRTISTCLVRPGDGFEGPVIVKANLNSGGIKEAELAVRGVIPKFRGGWFEDYKIFESPSLVPGQAWRHPDVVVEKFLPETRDGQYILRNWFFFGDRDINVACYSNSPIVKSANIIRREPVSEVPQELRDMRFEMGFDFGKFDYAIVDGRIVLYDVNRTPGVGSMKQEEFQERNRFLAEGILCYL